MVDRSWSLCAEDGYDAVAIACSAGGLRALEEILPGLPPSFPPIFVALHRGETTSDSLVGILQRCTGLHVRQAREGEQPRPGVVYISPGGRHLEIGPTGCLSVRRSGRIQFVCPSADVLFRSVADYYGNRSLGVVLTGRGTDGAAGARSIRVAGGFVLAQDPRSSEHPGMPHTAIETRKVDLVLPLREIGFALETLTRRAVAA